MSVYGMYGCVVDEAFLFCALCFCTWAVLVAFVLHVSFLRVSGFQNTVEASSIFVVNLLASKKASLPP